MSPHEESERHHRALAHLPDEQRLREILKIWTDAAVVDFKDSEQQQPEWADPIMPFLRLESVTPASPPLRPYPLVTFAFTVQPRHCNRLGNLHGGCTATLLDFCTSAALVPVARPGFWTLLGVSRTLSATYLRPAPAGTEVRIECEIVQVGRRLATVRATVRRADDGAVIALCEHGKVNSDPEAKV